ncbi:hypothetical protein KI387_027269, partial [Taxus chinensis]
MGDSAMLEEMLLELLGEPSLGEHFEEEEIEEDLFEQAYVKRDKGKLVYVIDGEEAESLDVNHSVRMCE